MEYIEIMNIPKVYDEIVGYIMSLLNTNFLVLCFRFVLVLSNSDMQGI